MMFVGGVIRSVCKLVSTCRIVKPYKYMNHLSLPVCLVSSCGYMYIAMQSICGLDYRHGVFAILVCLTVMVALKK